MSAFDSGKLPGNLITSAEWDVLPGLKPFKTVSRSSGADFYASGTADDVPIHNAFAALSSGGTVFLGSGTFLLNKRIVNGVEVGLSVPSNIILRGSGRGTTTIKIANAQFTGGTMASAVIANDNWNLGATHPDTNITIQDLTVDANMANQDVVTTGFQIGILYDPVKQGIIERCEVKNFQSWGIGIYGAETGGAVSDPVHDTVQQNWIHDGGNGLAATNFDCGIFVSYHRDHDSYLFNNFIWDIDGYGACLEDVPNNISVSWNTIHNVQGDGIRGFLSGGGYPLTQGYIGHNTIYNCGGIATMGTGIYLDSVGSGTVIDANDISNCNYRAILAQSRYIDVTGVKILNNRCDLTDLSATNVAAIQILGSSVTERLYDALIKGNFCRNSYRAYEDGVWMYRAQLLDNDFLGCTVVPTVTVGNYNRFRDNKGYVTWNSGTETGSGAQQEIHHGLAGTPNRVYLCELNTGLAVPYQSAAANADHIYVLATNAKSYAWTAEMIQ